MKDLRSLNIALLSTRTLIVLSAMTLSALFVNGCAPSPNQEDNVAVHGKAVNGNSPMSSAAVSIYRMDSSGAPSDTALNSTTADANGNWQMDIAYTDSRNALVVIAVPPSSESKKLKIAGRKNHGLFYAQSRYFDSQLARSRATRKFPKDVQARNSVALLAEPGVVSALLPNITDEKKVILTRATSMAIRVIADVIKQVPDPKRAISAANLKVLHSIGVGKAKTNNKNGKFALRGKALNGIRNSHRDDELDATDPTLLADALFSYDPTLPVSQQRDSDLSATVLDYVSTGIDVFQQACDNVTANIDGGDGTVDPQTVMDAVVDPSGVTTDDAKGLNNKTLMSDIDSAEVNIVNTDPVLAPDAPSPAMDAPLTVPVSNTAIPVTAVNSNNVPSLSVYGSCAISSANIYVDFTGYSYGQDITLGESACASLAQNLGLDPSSPRINYSFDSATNQVTTPALSCTFIDPSVGFIMYTLLSDPSSRLQAAINSCREQGGIPNALNINNADQIATLPDPLPTFSTIPAVASNYDGSSTYGSCTIPLLPKLCFDLTGAEFGIDSSFGDSQCSMLAINAGISSPVSGTDYTYNPATACPAPVSGMSVQCSYSNPTVSYVSYTSLLIPQADVATAYNTCTLTGGTPTGIGIAPSDVAISADQTVGGNTYTVTTVASNNYDSNPVIAQCVIDANRCVDMIGTAYSDASVLSGACQQIAQFYSDNPASAVVKSSQACPTIPAPGGMSCQNADQGTGFIVYTTLRDLNSQSTAEISACTANNSGYIPALINMTTPVATATSNNGGSSAVFASCLIDSNRCVDMVGSAFGDPSLSSSSCQQIAQFYGDDPGSVTVNIGQACGAVPTGNGLSCTNSHISAGFVVYTTLSDPSQVNAETSACTANNSGYTPVAI